MLLLPLRCCCCFCWFYCVLCFMLEIKSQERKLPQRDLLQLPRLHWSPSSCSPFPHHCCLMCLSGLFFGLLRAKRVLHVISFSSLFPYLPLCLSPFFVLTTKKSVLGQKVNVPQARTDQPEKRKKTETQTKSLATHLSITIHTQSTCVGNGYLGSIFPCNWWVNNTKYECE